MKSFTTGLTLISLSIALFSCTSILSNEALQKTIVKTEVFSHLPEAISNNAVAKAKVEGTWYLFSFNGLLEGKGWQDTSSKAFSTNLQTGESVRIKPVPSASGNDKGRLASIAATVSNKIYIFGGYTVETDHSEVSTPEVYRFDPQTSEYMLVTQMPTPVDDSVAFVFQDRYIYLVSGWHNDGNVDLVQILDTQDMSWHQGTSYPGAKVFGHAGGIIGNKMLISDGVKVIKVIDGKRQYGISDDNYVGEIDKNDFTKISWNKIAKHPTPAKYRMASVGSKALNKVVFVGGSENPYNYNGIGYNGIASEPSSVIMTYDFLQDSWQTFELEDKAKASMDHRGLLEVGDEFFIVGGMKKNQTSLKVITKYGF